MDPAVLPPAVPPASTPNTASTPNQNNPKNAIPASAPVTLAHYNTLSKVLNSNTRNAKTLLLRLGFQKPNCADPSGHLDTLTKKDLNELLRIAYLSYYRNHESLQNLFVSNLFSFLSVSLVMRVTRS